MGTLLHIDASARLERSLSRQLSRTFVEEWLAVHPKDRVIRRDVGRVPPPHVTEAWIAAAFTVPEKRGAAMRDVLAASDALVAEVAVSDLIVMGVPMYNYGMPSTLKAWIDQVARIGETFDFDLARGDYPIEGTLSGKRLVVLSARGEFGFQRGGIRESWNHLDPHLATCAHYFGVAKRDIHLVDIEYQEFRDERFERSVATALLRTRELARSLTCVTP